MRLMFKTLIGLVALAALVVLALVWDLAFNQQHVLKAVLGRDRVVQACSPALVTKLKAAGFDPVDLTFDDRPDLAFSSLFAQNLQGRFTFLDGTAGGRVDGVVACIATQDMVRVDFRTTVRPVRAT
ncbi:hypothetical protein [Lichenihabitans psoromatis]|uniref:hypothetical protein n=1 Tax=Lichenihabitans psoromatis TaxID=2528642 RepID=UPI001035A198|nr:hypothetical protein [Lichenihabitans psoromatis]